MGGPKVGKHTLLQRLTGKDPFAPDAPDTPPSSVTTPYNAPAHEQTWDRILLDVTTSSVSFDDKVDFCVILLSPRHDMENTRAYVLNVLTQYLRLMGYPNSKNDLQQSTSSSESLRPICVSILFNFEDLQRPFPRTEIIELVQEILAVVPSKLVELQFQPTCMLNCYGLNVLHHFIFRAYLQQKRYTLEQQLQQVSTQQTSTRPPRPVDYPHFVKLIQSPQKPKNETRSKVQKHNDDLVEEKSNKVEEESSLPSKRSVVPPSQPPSQQREQPPSRREMAPRPPVLVGKAALEAFLASDDEDDDEKDQEKPTAVPKKKKSITGAGGRPGDDDSDDDDEDDFFYDDDGHRISHNQHVMGDSYSDSDSDNSSVSSSSSHQRRGVAPQSTENDSSESRSSHVDEEALQASPSNEKERKCQNPVSVSGNSAESDHTDQRSKSSEGNSSQVDGEGSSDHECIEDADNSTENDSRRETRRKEESLSGDQFSSPSIEESLASKVNEGSKSPTAASRLTPHAEGSSPTDSDRETNNEGWSDDSVDIDDIESIPDTPQDMTAPVTSSVVIEKGSNEGSRGSNDDEDHADRHDQFKEETPASESVDVSSGENRVQEEADTTPKTAGVSSSNKNMDEEDSDDEFFVGGDSSEQDKPPTEEDKHAVTRTSSPPSNGPGSPSNNDIDDDSDDEFFVGQNPSNSGESDKDEPSSEGPSKHHQPLAYTPDGKSKLGTKTAQHGGHIPATNTSTTPTGGGLSAAALAAIAAAQQEAEAMMATAATPSTPTYHQSVVDGSEKKAKKEKKHKKSKDGEPKKKKDKKKKKSKVPEE